MLVIRRLCPKPGNILWTRVIKSFLNIFISFLITGSVKFSQIPAWDFCIFKGFLHFLLPLARLICVLPGRVLDASFPYGACWCVHSTPLPDNNGTVTVLYFQISGVAEAGQEPVFISRWLSLRAPISLRAGVWQSCYDDSALACTAAAPSPHRSPSAGWCLWGSRGWGQENMGPVWGCFAPPACGLSCSITSLRCFLPPSLLKSPPPFALLHPRLSHHKAEVGATQRNRPPAPLWAAPTWRGWLQEFSPPWAHNEFHSHCHCLPRAAPVSRVRSKTGSTMHNTALFWVGRTFKHQYI